MFLKRKKAKGKIYAGEILVVPRAGLRKFVSSIHPPLDRQFDQNQGEVVEETLRSLLELAPKSERDPELETDLAIDIIVPEYDFGEFLVLSAGNFSFPVTWRPSILVTGRLYEIGSGKTINATTVKHSVSWPSWGGKILSLTKLLRFHSFMSRADMERLTTEAYIKLLSKILKNS